MVQQRLPVDHQLAARYGDVDLHLEHSPLAVTQLGHVHNDAAAYDIFIQAIQLRCPLTYPCLCGIRALPMTKGNLEWNFHQALPPFLTITCVFAKEIYAPGPSPSTAHRWRLTHGTGGMSPSKQHFRRARRGIPTIVYLRAGFGLIPTAGATGSFSAPNCLSSLCLCESTAASPVPSPMLARLLLELTFIVEDVFITCGHSLLPGPDIDARPSKNAPGQVRLPGRMNAGVEGRPAFMVRSWTCRTFRKTRHSLKKHAT